VRQQLPPRGRTLRGSKCCEGRTFEDSKFRLEIQSLHLILWECGSDHFVRTLKTRLKNATTRDKHLLALDLIRSSRRRFSASCYFSSSQVKLLWKAPRSRHVFHRLTAPPCVYSSTYQESSPITGRSRRRSRGNPGFSRDRPPATGGPNNRAHGPGHRGNIGNRLGVVEAALRSGMQGDRRRAHRRESGKSSEIDRRRFWHDREGLP